MIDRRSAATLFTGLWNHVQGASADYGPPTTALGRLALASTADPSPVPWSWTDAACIVALTAALTACGALALIVVRICLSVGFVFAEGFGILRSGTFDHLSGELTPYSAAMTVGLLGLALYGSAVYSVRRYAIVRYGQPWAELGFRHAGWRTYGGAVALFLPLALGGMIVIRIEMALLGGSLNNPQIALLTNGMPPRPLNFLMLFVLLAIVAPFAEEAFFRGFLLRLLRKRLPAWTAAPLSAAAFALSHGVPVLFPWLFFLGIVYAALAERTRSLYPGMILHGMINALATLGIVVAINGW